MTTPSRTPDDLVLDAARTILDACSVRLVRVWLQPEGGATAPRLVAVAGDVSFAEPDEDGVRATLSADHVDATMLEHAGVANAHVGVPIAFGEQTLGYLEAYCERSFGFARAADLERRVGELGASLAAVLSTAEGTLASGGRILVTDDDPQIRALLVTLLRRRGFTCIEAANGLAALEAAKRDRPDLILIDWMMPVMDGRETVLKLKADEATRHIPVVMLTAQSLIDEKVMALEAGVQDFITKPFDARELIARVEQQMRWRKLLSDAGDESDAVPVPQGDTSSEPTMDVSGVAGDLWTKATDAAALGKHAEALALFLHEAETSEERKRFPRAAIAYRSAAVEAGLQQKGSLSNKLLRLAGKMYLNWSESTQDARAIQEGYVNAARCFLAAGNLQLAKKSIDFAHSYDSVISDSGLPPA